MNNDKVSNYLRLIGKIYADLGLSAATENKKLAYKKSGAAYTRAAGAVAKQVSKVVLMTDEERREINGIGPATSETIASLQDGDFPDRENLTKILKEYEKKYPKSAEFILKRASLTTGREKINNLIEIVEVGTNKGKPFITKSALLYLLRTASEDLQQGHIENLEEDPTEKLEKVSAAIEELMPKRDGDLIDISPYKDLLASIRTESNNTDYHSYILLRDGMLTVDVRYEADLFLSYNDEMKDDLDILIPVDDERMSLADALDILKLVDSKFITVVESALEHDADYFLEKVEKKRDETELMEAPEDEVVEEEEEVVDEEEEEVVEEVKKKPEIKKPAGDFATDTRTYRQRIIELLESMAIGYNQMNRIQTSNLYSEAATRVKNATGKTAHFENLNQLEQVVYRKKLLAPTEITNFIDRFEKKRASDDEKKAYMLGNKSYSERKEQEVVGNTPISKDQIIAFVKSLADAETKRGSLAAATAYKEIVDRLQKAKAEIRNAREGYEAIWYKKPLLPYEVAVLVENHAASRKQGGSTVQTASNAFDYTSLLSKSAKNFMKEADVTLEILVKDKNLSEDDRVLIYWSPVLSTPSLEATKAILSSCGLKGSLNKKGDVISYKPALPLVEIMKGPLLLFTRGIFQANGTKYMILQVASTESPFVVVITE